MGEYADAAIDDMLAYDEYLLENADRIDDPDLIWSPFYRKDRRRNRVLSCPICGAKPLYWLEEDGKWYLGDYDEYEDEVRHVCSMKGRLNAFKRS